MTLASFGVADAEVSEHSYPHLRPCIVLTIPSKRHNTVLDQHSNVRRYLMDRANALVLGAVLGMSTIRVPIGLSSREVQNNEVHQ